MRYRRVCGSLFATVLTCSMAVNPVLAAPEDSLESLQNEQNSLEDKKSDAQSQLNDLQTQLQTLLKKTTELENDLVSTGQEISQAEADLTVAEEKKESQYEAMKLRIKYVYESGGDAAMLEKIFSSGDITSILTQAEYSQKVHEYDRAQLQAYAETVSEIEELNETLKTEMANLEKLETEYQEQQSTLNATISSKQDEISNLDGMIQEAARRVLEEQQKQAEEAAAQAANSTSGSGAEDNASDSGNSNTSGGSSSGSNGSGSGSADNDSDSGTGGDNSTGGSDHEESTGDSVVSRAYRQMGKPYKWGAAGPDSFDCSGLVSYCLTGNYVHTWSTLDFMTWTRVSNPQPGDICTSVTHCGIYIGNGQMIHAPQTGDYVKISSVPSNMIYVRY